MLIKKIDLNNRKKEAFSNMLINNTNYDFLKAKIKISSGGKNIIKNKPYNPMGKINKKGVDL